MKYLFFLLAVVVLPVQCLLAQWPVLQTNTPETSGRGQLQAALGVEYLSKHQVPSAAIPRALLRTFVASAHIGVSRNVNLDLDWKGGLLATLQNGERGFDWGDLSVATRISILSERSWLPAMGIRTAVKLPNTSYAPYGLGNDETDYQLHILFGKHVGPVHTWWNVGLGIIGDPVNAGRQNDVYQLRLAALVPIGASTQVFSEILGMTGYIRDDDKLVQRFGMFQKFGELSLGFYSSFRIVGNERDFASAFDLSENWSIGISFRSAFTVDIFD
ncbi:MAG TPA: hypothetical protein VGB89_02500 [Bacteroidota bacterium]|jgi:hypothetical protein